MLRAPAGPALALYQFRLPSPGFGPPRHRGALLSQRHGPPAPLRRIKPRARPAPPRSHYDAAPGQSGEAVMPWMDFAEEFAWA